MLKRSPEIEYLKLNIDGNPSLLENTCELSSNIGIAVDGTPVFNLMLVWDFKAYDAGSGNRKLIDSRIFHEHQFKKFIEVTFMEVREMVIESHRLSNNLFERKLKDNKVNYRASALSEDAILQYSSGLFADLKKNLF